MQIVLIRHGMTAGNQARRYIGTTDEPLCADGAEQLRALAAKGSYPPVQRVYVSPMRRCVETAALVYPTIQTEPVAVLREQNFGLFENHTYAELCDNAAYRAWIGSKGAVDPPEGESGDAFWSRCRAGFAYLRADAESRGLERIAVVAHGGTFMALLGNAAEPRRDFYGWQAPNGGGWLVEMRGAQMLVRSAVGFADAMLDKACEEDTR